MRNYLSIYSLLVIAAIFTGCTDNNKQKDTVRLMFNLQPGTKYIYSMDSRQNIDQEIMGHASQIRQEIRMQSTYQVDKEDGHHKKLSIVYDRFYIKSSGSGASIEYDSADSTKQPPELRAAGNMVNKPFRRLLKRHAN